MRRTATILAISAAVLVLGLFAYLRTRKLPTPDAGSGEPGPTRPFEDAVAKSGLQSRLAALRSSLKPSIRLRTSSPGAVPPGRSKLGGRPDLPAGIVWPERDGKPMCFLAQLALADLAPLDSEKLLPRTGCLWFFHAGQDVWGSDPKHAGGWAVIFDPNARNLAPREFPAGLAADVRFAECNLTLEPEETLPPLDSPAGEALGITQESDGDAYDVLHAALIGADDTETEPVAHRVLGWPDPIQGDMQLECQLGSNGLDCGDASAYTDPRREALQPGAADWQLLLQIDSDENTAMMWGDGGRLYFWIRKQDLAARRFDRVWCILQCY
jgi:uncharacterized protein YwqG